MKKEIFIEYAYANGTASEDIDREKEIVGIRCWLDDDKHYFDLALYDAPETMDWYDAKCWCEKNYCRLPMKHEWEFVIANIKRIDKMSAEKPEVGDVWEFGDFLYHVRSLDENVTQTDLRNIEDLQKKIEFAKQAVDLFFKTEDESKLLEIAEWE